MPEPARQAVAPYTRVKQYIKAALAHQKAAA